ncbi:MAG: hypothetical protein ABDI19_04985 [Armatimonadota bacterium]
MRRFARSLGMLSLMLMMSIGQETEVPLVAIKGKIVEVGAPLQLVADTDVKEFHWLEDGRYLVYLRELEPYKRYEPTRNNPALLQLRRANALYLYDPVAKRITLIHQNNIDFWAVALQGKGLVYAVRDEIARKHGDEPSDELLETVSVRTAIYLRAPVHSQPKLIAQYEGNRVHLYLSPKGRYLAVDSSTPQVLDLQTGRVIRTFEQSVIHYEWVSETMAYLVRRREPRDVDFAVYDVGTNQLRSISQEAYRKAVEQVITPDRYSLPDTTSNLQLKRELQPGNAQPPAARLSLHSLNAQTQRFRQAVVAHDADTWLYSLAPNESGIAYRSWRGQLFYIPLRKRDPKTLVEQLACGETPTPQAIRKHYVANGKQIATSLLMYCQDYDETFPPNADVADLIMPYIKNREVFLDLFTGQMIFSYLLDGQTLTTIENPAETPIGRLDWGDPEFVVVLFADGHVKLQPRR